MQEHFKRQDELLLKTLRECGGGASAARAHAGPVSEPAAGARPADAGRLSSGESDGEEADGGGFEGCKRARTEASPGGARVAALVARFGGGRLRVAVADDSGDAAAGGPSEVQIVEAGYGASAEAVAGGLHPDEVNEQTADVAGASGVSTGAAAVASGERAASALAVNVYVQDGGGASAAAGEHYHESDAYEQVATSPGEAVGDPRSGAHDDSVVVHAEANNTTELDELLAAVTAGGEDSAVGVEHHEEAFERQAAVTAGGADAAPIVASVLPEEVRGSIVVHTPAEAFRATSDEEDAAFTTVRRRRPRRPREPLPTPPPRVNSRRERGDEAPEYIQELVDTLRGIGRSASAEQSEDGVWRLRADPDILDFLVEHELGNWAPT